MKNRWLLLAAFAALTVCASAQVRNYGMVNDGTRRFLEEVDYSAGIRDLHLALDKLGVKHFYYESPGTGHEWLTWRRSLRQFAPMLFR